MNKRALMACLAALMFATRADATISFFDVQYEANAITLTSDADAGFGTQSGTDLVSADAASVGLADIATAGAIAGPGLLSTSADVSAGSIGSAVSTAYFGGSFVNGSGVNLNLDFTTLDLASGTGGASTTLFVSLKSDGVTLFEDYVTGPWSFSYTPTVGTTSILGLTLSSDVNAAFAGTGAGDASAFGLVSITGAVPEPSTYLMFALGLGGVAALRAHARRKAARG